MTTVDQGILVLVLSKDTNDQLDTFTELRDIYYDKSRNTQKAKRTKIVNKMDPDIDNNLMPICPFRNVFPRVRIEQLTKHKDRNIILCMSNKTNIPQLGACIMIIKHKDKHKAYTFFVVPGNNPG